jgi:hypothetical protein
MAAGFDALAERVDSLQAKRAIRSDRVPREDEARAPRTGRPK